MFNLRYPISFLRQPDQELDHILGKGTEAKGRDWQTFAVKDQKVNILSFEGLNSHCRRLNSTILTRKQPETALNLEHEPMTGVTVCP